jgi:hypothetical protein
MSHDPRPMSGWKVAPGRQVADGLFHVLDGPGLHYIATVCGNPAILPDCEAIANQIAASGELLEALRSFGVLACTPEWEAKRQAAIAKATGCK